MLKLFPPTKKIIDIPIFPKTYNITKTNCLLSNKLLTSTTKADIVVNETQKPIAIRENLGSRFHVVYKTEKTPKIKQPMAITTKIFNGSPPKITIGDSASLYRKKTPQTASMLKE